MTTPAPEEEIDLILGLFQRDIERHYGGRTVGKTLTGEEAKSQILAYVDKRELQARLIELDLFEQFLNTPPVSAITKGDLSAYKMSRLNDLETRSEALTNSKGDGDE